MWINDRISLIAILCDLLLGGAVLLTNSKRPSSQVFFALTLLIAGWIYSLDHSLVVATPSAAALWIRVTSTVGAFFIVGFAMLRITLIYYQDAWLNHLWRARIWLTVGLLAAAICWTNFFLHGVDVMPFQPGIAPVLKPMFGTGSLLYFIYFLLGGSTVSALLIWDQYDRQIHGIRRVEIQFVVLALLVCVLTVAISGTYGMVAHSTRLVRYAPLRIIAFDAIIAYGIASRGILHVGAAFRLLFSYALLALYASLIFLVGWICFGFIFASLFGSLDQDSNFPTSLCAAVLTAVLFNITGTPVRRFTQRLLPQEIDLERIVTDVSRLVQSMTTLENLLERVTNYISRAVGSPQVCVLIREEGLNQWRAYPAGADNAMRTMPEALLNPLLAREPDVALEDLQRRAPSQARDTMLAEMSALDTDLILPVRYQGEVTGLLVFAPRSSGRIYGGTGRTTLRLIAEQLGVALANSRLYTEARQSEAYNQFLVEHLTCGVIATDPQGQLTVVNPEARRLLQLDELSPPAEIELLPEIAGVITPTLQGDMIARDEELILRSGARDQAHLRVSCLPFASEKDELLGAVLVISDHTALERLQRQVRQADRLASIGTLASGMAHEIKNPLTALKTFTQLLPKRYNDAEFRDDFSGLAGSEIARIERIVNQLLAFARPAPLMIEQVSLHEIIDAAVRLVSPQAARTSVQIRKSLAAPEDSVAADKDRLQQVLLNLMLNAVQATEAGGWVELSTEFERVEAEAETFLRLDVRDNGSGIAADMLPHIFDPFFTTKSEGTGLGLSVSYNIILEHKGRLEVRSEIGQGTCFSVYLPACS